MTDQKMHADEVETGPELVRRLVSEQFPQWAALPVRRVDSFGTDHAIYRLGDGLCARLPRIDSATAQAAVEARWLPWLAPQLPLALPVPLALGSPAAGYPFAWSVCRWLPGASASAAALDLDQAAGDMAAFIGALSRIDTTAAPPRQPHDRGGALAERDDEVRRSIAELGDRIDGNAALRSWEESLGAPAWAGPDVWLHGDLLPGNLLVSDRRLAAVIDFGCLTVGDPAWDFLPAWNLFSDRSRDRFRACLGSDNAAWLRGRGAALCQAVVALPYYWDTNPGMVTQAAGALARVLADTPFPR